MTAPAYFAHTLGEYKLPADAAAKLHSAPRDLGKFMPVVLDLCGEAAEWATTALLHVLSELPDKLAKEVGVTVSMDDLKTFNAGFLLSTIEQEIPRVQDFGGKDAREISLDDLASVLRFTALQSKTMLLHEELLGKTMLDDSVHPVKRLAAMTQFKEVGEMAVKEFLKTVRWCDVLADRANRSGFVRDTLEALLIESLVMPPGEEDNHASAH